MQGACLVRAVMLHVACSLCWLHVVTLHLACCMSQAACSHVVASHAAERIERCEFERRHATHCAACDGRCVAWHGRVCVQQCAKQYGAKSFGSPMSEHMFPTMFAARFFVIVDRS